MPRACSISENVENGIAVKIPPRGISGCRRAITTPRARKGNPVHQAAAENNLQPKEGRKPPARIHQPAIQDRGPINKHIKRPSAPPWILYYARVSSRLVSPPGVTGLTCRGATSLDRIAGSRLRAPRRTSHGVDIATINPVRPPRESLYLCIHVACVFHPRAPVSLAVHASVYRPRRFLLGPHPSL